MTSDKMDDDDFDLGALKSAMDASMPPPDPVKKAETLALARENFARVQKSAQGSAEAARQSSGETPKRGFLSGVLDMILTKTTAGLTATTALVAVGLLIYTPAGQSLLNPPANLGIFAEPALLETPADLAPAVEAPVRTTTTGEDTRAAELSSEAPLPTPPLVAPAPVPQVGFNAEDGSTLFSDGEIGVMPMFDTQTPVAGLIHNGAGNTAVLSRAAPDAPVIAPPEPLSEEFAHADNNPVRVVAEDPVSTLSIDVDTAAYSIIRSSLQRGDLPPQDAVRIEEMINYFPYDYAAPGPEDISPFRPTVNVFETPWNPDTQLIHIGLQGELPLIEDRPPLNLVFLIDTSGSMNQPSKLPLLVQSFRLMLDRLQPEDEVAIVTYAGSAGVALEPTPASDTATINRALSVLQAGGSTNGVGGLQAAYDLAEEMTGEGEVSRVLLATDGDFNVGISDPEALTDYIAEQRETGIYLSVLGFGRGNLQDDTMQALAQNGNGTAAYIDTLNEAQRVLVDQLVGALYPIADDLKVQVEFNPARIAEYRLIGYETRLLAREEFNDDAVDAGELGAGHSVTAIYEVTPVGSPARLTDPLRYGEAELPAATTELDGELGFLRLRWKEPGAEESQLVDLPIVEGPAPDSEAQFAAAIAGFGQLLRGDTFLGEWSYADAIALANENRGSDPFGYRTEAVQLMRLAESLSGE